MDSRNTKKRFTECCSEGNNNEYFFLEFVDTNLGFNEASPKMIPKFKKN